ncbi:hypothetical protein PFISCL1PPCAC_19838, partial [Pristionchus fissidentatus]
AGHLVNVDMASSALKKLMRKEMSKSISKLSKEEIENQSTIILTKIRNVDWFNHSSVVGVFVSTHGEVITDPIIDLLLNLKKEVYIPHFTKSNNNMIFVKLTSSHWKEGLSPTVWNIRQHSSVESSNKLHIPIDLLIMPGVSFSTSTDGRINRLGHGMGYFDRFLNQQMQLHGRLPYLVGLSLREQIVDTVPIEDHDVPLDCLVYAA